MRRALVTNKDFIQLFLREKAERSRSLREAPEDNFRKLMKIISLFSETGLFLMPTI